MCSIHASGYALVPLRVPRPGTDYQVRELGKGRVDLTIGSALDIFGGKLPYEDVVKWQRARELEAGTA